MPYGRGFCPSQPSLVPVTSRQEAPALTQKPPPPPSPLMKSLKSLALPAPLPLPVPLVPLLLSCSAFLKFIVSLVGWQWVGVALRSSATRALHAAYCLPTALLSCPLFCDYHLLLVLSYACSPAWFPA